MFLVFKRKGLMVSLALVLIGAILSISLSTTSSAGVFFGKSTRKIPVYAVEPEQDKKVIALTFDAAWGADKTQGILDILDRYDATATFFLVGFWIDKYQDQTKAIANAGCEIANHSRNHLNMPKLAEDEIKNEIEYVNDRVYELTSIKPKYFRAPFGDYSDRLMSVVEGMGMVGVQWSIDTLDWKGLSAKEIYNRVVTKAKSGDIVLFHNNSDHVLDALLLVLEELKRQGFEFVTLSSLVKTENYMVDSNGVQHAK